MKTETKTQHTPTPWVVVSDTMRGLKPSIMNSKHTEEIALLEHKANAAFIVRAVNGYDALKTLNEELLQAAKYACQFVDVWDAKKHLEEAIAEAESK